ncbi:methylglutaconyl-CoA hydratase [Deinobacterium chartae]|uniref:Methylglutaconyl-CoA hydratase n=1 Tax=Deinobacterium chartae TaxID=521158 RepID=A0A841HTE6_9DEIO|nr:enoyl-CoA hydratase-related protein [Deinobacterium chartae]MBB6096627.1 methylglutaconyl-CoA hydratase [Deinobacterium chartae]
MEHLILERRGGVALVTLNRPEQRNALSAALITELLAAFDDLEADPAVRAVVLTGAGGVFSSGADLRALQAMGSASSEEKKRDSALLARLLQRIYTSPKPVVAALEGAAVAGGAGLASVCDVVVAGESTRIGYTEVRLGFVAAIVSVFLLRMVGEKAARELLLTGKLFPASRALEMGLISRVVPDGTALECALEVAGEIVHNSPTGLATTKELLAHLPGMGLEEGLRYAVSANAWTRTTDDLQEGVAAFFEKRSPRWG